MSDDSSPSTWFEEWKDGGFVLNEDDISDFLADLPGSESAIDASRKRGASLSLSSEQPSKKPFKPSPVTIFMVMSRQSDKSSSSPKRTHGVFSSLEKAMVKIEKLKTDQKLFDEDMITQDGLVDRRHIVSNTRSGGIMRRPRFG